MGYRLDVRLSLAEKRKKGPKTFVLCHTTGFDFEAEEKAWRSVGAAWLYWPGQSRKEIIVLERERKYIFSMTCEGRT